MAYNLQNSSKSVKRVMVKGDGSLGALLSRSLERLKVFRIPDMPGYLKGPIRENEYFKLVVRNIQNSLIGGNNQQGVVQR